MTDQTTTTNKPVKRTHEEIEALKEDWAKDPCFDIEDAEGFEAHREELKAWREMYDREIEAKLRRMEARQRIQTIRTRIYENGDKGNVFLDDDKISLLVASGWQISNVSFVPTVDHSDFAELHVVDRYVTLTRNTDRLAELEQQVEQLKSSLKRISERALDEIDYLVNDIPF